MLQNSRDKRYQGLTLTWCNVNVSQKKSKRPNLFSLCGKKSTSQEMSDFGSSNDNSQILKNVNGCVKPGEALAIMGSSGAGKTTLLNLLNCRNMDSFTATGEIKINGKLVEADDLSSKCAYVQQDDLYIGTLTVREHLTFLAMLKMGSQYTREEKMYRVDEMLQEFKLEKCQNVQIGYYDSKKGISGGEKRRLSFASELLTGPQVLFCDEPTSGLDAYMAAKIVDTIGDLAAKGKTILCTIHQPSSQIFEKFDKLCLLAEGRVAYFGHRELAFDFFKNIGFACPMQYNPADYFIDLLSIRASKKDDLRKIHAICDAFESSAYHRQIMQDIDSHVNQTSRRTSITTQKIKYKAGYMSQFCWLLYRQVWNTFREPFATRIMFISAIVMGLFLGLTYLQQNNDQKGIQNKNGLLFMTMMHISITHLFGVANKFHAQWLVSHRDIKNRVYSVVVYFLAKWLSEVPQNVFFPLITATLVFWLANVHTSFEVYALVTCVLVLSANAAVGFGTLLAIITSNLDSTVGLIAPTFVPMLIFAGFLINSSSIPVYFVWIKYISWMHYGYEAMMVSLWQHVDSIQCPSLAQGNIASSRIVNSTNMFELSFVNCSLQQQKAQIIQQQRCLYNGTDVLNYLSIDKNDFTMNIVLLILFIFVWPLVACIVLYVKTKFGK